MVQPLIQPTQTSHRPYTPRQTSQLIIRATMLALISMSGFISTTTVSGEPFGEPHHPLTPDVQTQSSPGTAPTSSPHLNQIQAHDGVLPALGALALKGTLSPRSALTLSQFLTKMPPQIQKIAISALIAGTSIVGVITALRHRPWQTVPRAATTATSTDILIPPSASLATSSEPSSHLSDATAKTPSRSASSLQQHSSSRGEFPPPLPHLLSDANETEDDLAAGDKIRTSEEVKHLTKHIKQFSHHDRLLTAHDAHELLLIAPSLSTSRLQNLLSELKSTQGDPLFNEATKTWWNRRQLYNFIYNKTFSTLEMHLLLGTVLTPPPSPSTFTQLAELYNREVSSLKIMRALIISRMLRHHIQPIHNPKLNNRSSRPKINQALYQLTPELIRHTLSPRFSQFKLVPPSEKDWNFISGYHLAKFISHKELRMRNELTEGHYNTLLKMFFHRHWQERSYPENQSSTYLLMSLMEYLVENNIISNSLWAPHHNTAFSPGQIEFILTTQNHLTGLSTADIRAIGARTLTPYGNYLTLAALRQFLISFDGYPLLETILLSQVLQINPIPKLKFIELFKISDYEHLNITRHLKQLLEQYLASHVAQHEPHSLIAAAPTSPSPKSASPSSSAALTLSSYSPSEIHYEKTYGDLSDIKGWTIDDESIFKTLQAISPQTAIDSINHTDHSSKLFTSPIKIPKSTYIEFIHNHLTDPKDALIFMGQVMSYPEPLGFWRIEKITGLSRYQITKRFRRLQLDFYGLISSGQIFSERYPQAVTWGVYKVERVVDELAAQLNYQNLPPNELLPIIRERLEVLGYTFHSQIHLQAVVNALRNWERTHISEHYHWQAYLRLFPNSSQSFRFLGGWKLNRLTIITWLNQLKQPFLNVMSPYIIKQPHTRKYALNPPPAGTTADEQNLGASDTSTTATTQRTKPRKLSQQALSRWYNQVDPALVEARLKFWYELRSGLAWPASIMHHLPKFTATFPPQKKLWELYLKEILGLDQIKQTKDFLLTEQFNYHNLKAQMDLENRLKNFIDAHQPKFLARTNIGQLVTHRQKSSAGYDQWIQQYYDPTKWLVDTPLRQRLRLMSLDKLLTTLKQSSWFRRALQRGTYMSDLHFILFAHEFLTTRPTQLVFIWRMLELQPTMKIEELATTLNLSVQEVLHLEFRLKTQWLHLITTHNLHAPAADQLEYPHLIALFNHFASRANHHSRTLLQHHQDATLWAYREFQFTGSMDPKLLSTISRAERTHLTSDLHWAVYLQLMRSDHPLSIEQIATLWQSSLYDVKDIHSQLYEAFQPIFTHNTDVLPAGSHGSMWRDTSAELINQRARTLLDWQHSSPELVSAFTTLTPAHIAADLMQLPAIAAYLPASFSQLHPQEYVYFEKAVLIDPLLRQIFLHLILESPGSPPAAEIAKRYEIDLEQVNTIHQLLVLAVLHQVAYPYTKFPLPIHADSRLNNTQFSTLAQFYSQIIHHQNTPAGTTELVIELAPTLGFLIPQSSLPIAEDLTANVKDFETYILTDPVRSHIYLSFRDPELKLPNIAQLWQRDELDISRIYLTIRHGLTAILADHFDQDPTAHGRESLDHSDAGFSSPATATLRAYHPATIIAAMQSQTWFHKNSSINVPITIGQYLSFMSQYLAQPKNAAIFLNMLTLPDQKSFKQLGDDLGMPEHKAIRQGRNLQYFLFHYLTTRTLLDPIKGLPHTNKVYELSRHYHARLQYMYSSANDRHQLWEAAGISSHSELNQAVRHDMQTFESAYLTSELYHYIYLRLIMNYHKLPHTSFEEASLVWNVPYDTVTNTYSVLILMIMDIFNKHGT